MIVLCLSVAMAALFISVLNSKTAKSITLGDNSPKHMNSSGQ